MKKRSRDDLDESISISIPRSCFNSLICNSCNNYFNDPWTLTNCLHSLCGTCLDNLIKKKKGLHPCPTCGELFDPLSDKSVIFDSYKKLFTETILPYYTINLQEDSINIQVSQSTQSSNLTELIENDNSCNNNVGNVNDVDIVDDNNDNNDNNDNHNDNDNSNTIQADSESPLLDFKVTSSPKSNSPLQLASETSFKDNDDSKLDITSTNVDVNDNNNNNIDSIFDSNFCTSLPSSTTFSSIDESQILDATPLSLLLPSPLSNQTSKSKSKQIKKSSIEKIIQPSEHILRSNSLNNNNTNNNNSNLKNKIK